MKFSVPDMSCGHCTAAIETALTAADPAAQVSCDLPSRSVQIDSRALSAEQVSAALKDAGYEASPV